MTLSPPRPLLLFPTGAAYSGTVTAIFTRSLTLFTTKNPPSVANAQFSFIQLYMEPDTAIYLPRYLLQYLKILPQLLFQILGYHFYHRCGGLVLVVAVEAIVVAFPVCKLHIDRRIALLHQHQVE